MPDFDSLVSRLFSNVNKAYVTDEQYQNKIAQLRNEPTVIVYAHLTMIAEMAKVGALEIPLMRGLALPFVRIKKRANWLTDFILDDTAYGKHALLMALYKNTYVEIADIDSAKRLIDTNSMPVFVRHIGRNCIKADPTSLRYLMSQSLIRRQSDEVLHDMQIKEADLGGIFREFLGKERFYSVISNDMKAKMLDSDLGL